jgi:alkylated DNA nucleotide flippase Atl1
MSSRAEQVAEVLWELKRAEKLGTYTSIAERAGFSAGANGKTMIACMKKIRTHWPHLHWWRVLDDNARIEINSEQARELEQNGFELEPSASNEKYVKPFGLEELLIDWKMLDEAAEQAVEAESA